MFFSRRKILEPEFPTPLGTMEAAPRDVKRRKPLGWLHDYTQRIFFEKLLNQPENGKYNLISGRFNKISKKNSLYIVEVEISRQKISRQVWQQILGMKPTAGLQRKDASRHNDCSLKPRDIL